MGCLLQMDNAFNVMQVVYLRSLKILIDPGYGILLSRLREVYFIRYMIK